jgi:carboxymethylenebutenolidase
VALEGYLAEEVALDCAEGLLSRREALRRLALLGLSATAATTLLAACGDDSDAGGDAAATTPAAASSAAAESSASTGPTASPTTAATAASTEEIRFAGPRGELIGVLSTAPDPKGAVLVIHENRGLTPHIRSIPPRLADSGYTALAIDLLSEEGGTASLPSEGDATAALGAASQERLIEDMRAGIDELERRAPGAEIAMIGFCFGGGMTWLMLASGEPRLAAAVPFYGPAPANPDFSGSSQAAVLGIYAGNDDRVNASQTAARAGLEAAGMTHEIRTFDGVDHAFFNDTGQRYNADVAAQAYDEMIAWFDEHLS